MKKLILASVFTVSSLIAVNAQEDVKEPVALNDTKKELAVTSTTADAAAQDFKTIKADDLPQAVKDAVAKDFAGATISKAAVNAKGVYQIVIATEEKASQTLYANAEGEWIKKE